MADAHHLMFDTKEAPWGVERNGGSVPQMKKVDPLQLPAAGKKSNYVVEHEQSSSFKNYSSKELQSELSKQLLEKEKIENEYWRIGNQCRSKQQLEKKRHVEELMQENNHKIHSIKQSLREIGQLHKRQ